MSEFDFCVEQLSVRLYIPFGRTWNYQDPFLIKTGELKHTHKKMHNMKTENSSIRMRF